MEQESKPLECELIELDKRAEEDLVRTIVELVNALGDSAGSHNYFDLMQRNSKLQDEFYRYHPITGGFYKQTGGQYRLIGWLKLAESFNGQEKYSAENSRIRLVGDTSVA